MKSAPGCIWGLMVLGWSLGAGAAGPPLVRVSLGPLDQPVVVQGEQLNCQAGGRGRRGRNRDQVQLAPAGKKVQVGRERATPPVECRASGPIQVAGRAYRGALRVVGGSPLTLVNVVPLEEYLAGVINGEISSAWPEQAVKAQAILARTYAVYKMRQRREARFDLEATVQDQVYLGAAVEDEAARRAVADTAGLILTFAGEPIQAFYHSSCGGRTESPQWIWGGQPEPYQQSVACGFCEDAPVYFWRYPAAGVADPAELSRKLDLGEPVVELQVLSQSPSGRAAQVRVAGRNSARVLSGREFREALGRDAVKSTLFEFQAEAGGWVILGSGSGHGAGMCQWGARGLAAAGRTSEEILRHYFPGTEIQKLD